MDTNVFYSLRLNYSDGQNVKDAVAFGYHAYFLNFKRKKI